MNAKDEVRLRHRDIYDVMDQAQAPQTTRVGRSTSTGVVSLDAALEGPLPTGAIEIYGEASTGKSTLLYETIATAQKSGMLVALCASEYLDLPYMRKIGVNLNELVLITGNNAEDVLNAAMYFLHAHEDTRVVLAFDSATGLRPRDDSPGAWAAMLDVFLEHNIPRLGSASCMVLVDQVRVKRSIDPRKFFVDGVVDSTAKRIIDRFSLRMELRRGVDREDSHEMEVNIVESTVSKPAIVTRIPMRKGEGIDTMKDLLTFAVDMGAVTMAGSWFKFGGELMECGIEKTVALLERDHALAQQLLDQLMVKA